MNIDKLKSLLAVATPGPWKNAGTCTVGEIWPVKGESTECIAENLRNKNAELIVVMRNCLPELLAVVEAANSLGDTELSFDYRLNKIISALDKLEKRLEKA